MATHVQAHRAYRTVGVVATRADAYTGAGRGAFSAPARHLMRVGKVRASERETGPTITAVLEAARWEAGASK
jgi:hypothetical protein